MLKHFPPLEKLKAQYLHSKLVGEVYRGKNELYKEYIIN